MPCPWTTALKSPFYDTYFFLKHMVCFLFHWTASFVIYIILNLFEEVYYNCFCQTGGLLNYIDKYLSIQLSPKPENNKLS